MKKACLATVVLALTVPAFAQTPAGSVPPADQTFVMNTVKANMAEVELGDRHSRSF